MGEHIGFPTIPWTTHDSCHTEIMRYFKMQQNRWFSWGFASNPLERLHFTMISRNLSLHYIVWRDVLRELIDIEYIIRLFGASHSKRRNYCHIVATGDTGCIIPGGKGYGCEHVCSTIHSSNLIKNVPNLSEVPPKTPVEELTTLPNPHVNQSIQWRGNGLKR